MSTSAKVVCDSISESGHRITTLVLEYPRIIHSEFMTHRQFSRNASSSRAIPVEKQIERVERDPFIPEYWGANQKGMQADKEIEAYKIHTARIDWLASRDQAIISAKELALAGTHKQLANRLLEPFSHIQVIVTATEWDNFFLQRLDKNAQPEIQELARAMKVAMNESTPNQLGVGQWHLPFIHQSDDSVKFYQAWREKDQMNHPLTHVPINEVLRMVSVARCARVSYGLNERGWGDIEKDLQLYEMLSTNNHWSPFEHQATPMPFATHKEWLTPEEDMQIDAWYLVDGVTHRHEDGGIWSGNFKGWIQNRQLIQQQ